LKRIIFEVILSNKRFFAISGIAAGFVAAGLTVAAEWIPPRNWGPFNCTTCKVAPYMPDVSTLAFLRDFHTKMGLKGNRLFINDTITVCAGSFCTTYTLTDSGDFMGSGAKNNTPPGGGGGGANNGGGRGGGTNLGGSGGCVGSCTGVVTVKPPFKEDPR
jgi:hypothetical protein